MKLLPLLTVAGTLYGLVHAPSTSANPKIAKHAVLPIKQKNNPRLYAEWGANGFRRINELMPGAAQVVARSPDCDKVDLVEVSEQRSVPVSKIVFFVDCSNGKRFFVDQSEIAKK